jgi:uncharacterized protein (DUF1015 family)
LWVINDPATVTEIGKILSSVEYLYVADGHHRSAAAARVGAARAAANPGHRGDEEYNFFLAVLFPHNQLRIMDYNRVVKDLNAMSSTQCIEKLRGIFEVRESSVQARPAKKADFGMFLEGKWYTLTAKASLLASNDPVERLDVSILQRNVLAPLLGIEDPRTSKRIDFVGGIRGLQELEKRVRSGEMKVAFALFPTSIEELLAIADAGKIMPPKSTWFEPKLRDGMVVHFLG